MVLIEFFLIEVAIFVAILCLKHDLDKKREKLLDEMTKKTTEKMPIKKENRDRYPKNWKEIRQQILQRANNRCEFCGRKNHSIVDNGHGKMIKVVLTIAHLNHTPEDCRPENLRALCQRCHNRYDAKHRAETRKNNNKK